jgi:hypothetical protein
MLPRFATQVLRVAVTVLDLVSCYFPAQAGRLLAGASEPARTSIAKLRVPIHEHAADHAVVAAGTGTLQNIWGVRCGGEELAPKLASSDGGHTQTMGQQGVCAAARLLSAAV